MKILLNGQTLEIPQGRTLKQILEDLGHDQAFVAVALNRSCVRRKDLAATMVNESDEIEILAPQAGG